jgi:hypothetical protein
MLTCVLLMGPRAAPIAFEPRFAHLPGTPLSSGTLSLSLGEGAARFLAESKGRLSWPTLRKKPGAGIDGSGKSLHGGADGGER